MNIRAADVDDVAGISELLVSVWKSSYRDFVPVSFLESLSVEKQIVRHRQYMKKGVKYILIEGSDSIIGFASYGKSRFESHRDASELYSLYVDSGKQKEGYGTALLNHVVSDLKKNSNRLLVSVFQENPYSQFYSKKGYQKIDTEMIDVGNFCLQADVVELKFK